MKLVFLDAKTIGDDIDLSAFDQLGEVVKYSFSQPEEVPERVTDADVLIVNKIRIDEAAVKNARNLKLVCVTATGTNNLDKAYLESRGIAWRNVADYSTESVAQHTFAMLFFLLEKLRYYDEYVKEGRYINDTIFTHFAEHFYEIKGKTWGIIGLGNIGRRVAAIAEARDKGDLSENAEYDAAKEAQGMLEMKINQLKATIGDAKIIDTSKLNADTVQILTRVELKNVKTGMKMAYTIVSESEANLKEGKISVTTPIAQGLLGKKVGDIAEITIPQGKISLEVTGISF